MSKKNATNVMANNELAGIAQLPLDKLLSVALFVPMGDPNGERPDWGLPLLFWGPPGISKTTQARNYLNAIRMPFASVIAATRLPEDFGGAPVPDGNGGLNMVPTLPVMKRFAGQSATVFFDELGNAPLTVMGVLLDTIQTRHVGDLDLGPHVRMIAAANRPEDGLGRELLPALANRFAHYEVAPPVASAWVAWLQGADVREQLPSFTEIETRVKTGWNAAWTRARAISAGFMTKLPDRIYQFPAPGNPSRGRAWASHRTWEYATRVAATASCLGVPDDVRDAVMVGCVGAVAMEWVEWAAQADLPDPMDVLEGRWEPRRDRLDITVAAVTSMASTIISETDTKRQTDLAVMGWKFLQRMINAGGMADLVVGPARTLAKAKLSRVGEVGDPIAKVATPVLSAMSNAGLSELMGNKAAFDLV